MRRSLLKRRLRRIINEVMHEQPVEMHRCISGDSVPIDSPECIEDLQFRLDDAASDRDVYDTRTDARVHYNGLLKVLRRKLRQSKKLQPMTDI